jgi:hypothetical protein
MGVYLCLTDNVHSLDASTAIPFERIQSFENIRKQKQTFVFLGSGTHKIKKKAEQLACLDALNKIDRL